MIETIHLDVKRDGKPMGRIAIVRETERNTPDLTLHPSAGHTRDDLVAAMNNVVSVLCGEVGEITCLAPNDLNPEAEFRA